jgi:hypothetical protein
MRTIGKDEACVVFCIFSLLAVFTFLAYTAGWEKGYIASLVDAKKGLPPRWVITHRDDGTSGWEKNTTNKIR